jgi:hypothetical protein
MPSLEERVNHILTKQVFGIGITYLTSLLARRSVYCSKHAQGKHSIAKGFASDEGNIWFERTEHTWADGKCTYCGASKKALDRGEGLETHAYAFIHSDEITTRVAELFGGKMQFDVIIGNPPYQLDDGGYGSSAAPIYQLFVEKALDLDPHYAVFVTPSRWMAGGKGLDKYRERMLSDKRMRSIVDYRSSRRCRFHGHRLWCDKSAPYRRPNRQSNAAGPPLNLLTETHPGVRCLAPKYFGRKETLCSYPQSCRENHSSDSCKAPLSEPH